MKYLFNKFKEIKHFFIKRTCSYKERKAFSKGWLEGRFFIKNYGSLIGDDKNAIIEQINEDWEDYKNRN